MTDPFDRVLDRAADHGMGETALCEAAGIDYHRWWRAKTGRNAKRVTTMTVLRQAEALLDSMDPPPPCSLCGERVAKPCDQFGCPQVAT